MFLYRAYDLIIDSEIELPGWQEGTGVPDVTVRFEKLNDEQYGDNPNRGGTFFGYIYDDLAVLVENGKRIVVDIRSDVEAEEARPYITGVLMAILLRQRGYMAFHACSVARNGKAIGFLGESGWGKSTLAETFSSQGFTLLNDDILALKEDARGLVVVPGYPHIKLRKDTGDALIEGYDNLPSFYEGHLKRLRPVEAFTIEPVPLKALFFLEPEYRERTSAELLPPRDALFRLAYHTRAAHLFTDSESQALHLKHCSDLIRRVPMYLLRRQHSLDQLHRVVDIVERLVYTQDVEALS